MSPNYVHVIRKMMITHRKFGEVPPIFRQTQPNKRINFSSNVHDNVFRDSWRSREMITQLPWRCVWSPCQTKLVRRRSLGEKKGAKQKRHVFTFESRLQGFAQIKSLIAGTGCCKWPAFPTFFTRQHPFKTLQERSRRHLAFRSNTFYFMRIFKEETDEFAYLTNRYK